MVLIDPTGREIGADERRGALALVRTWDAVCVEQRGEYRIVVTVRGANSAIAVQVWRALVQEAG